MKGRRTTDPETGEWYVYALVDPRDQGIFYIGKGKGRRAFQHELEAKRGRVRNAKKYERIQQILSDGQEVHVEILATFDDEEAAYSHEAELIRGHQDLLNLMPGGGGARSIPIAVASATAGLKRAETTLQRVMPFDQWVAKRNPPAWMLPIHQDVCENLRELASRCRQVIDKWRAA